MRKKKQQFSAPDYFIAIAVDRPQAQVFMQMIQSHLAQPHDVDPDPKFRALPWTSPTEWAARRDLTPNEEAAVLVYGDALLSAFNRKDMESIRELASWGAGMLLRFNDFQKNHLYGDEPHHGEEPHGPPRETQD